MILLFIWAVGAAFLSWVIWTHGYLRDLLPLAACVAWAFWTFGMLAVAVRRIQSKAAKVIQTAEMRKAVAAAVAREQERKQKLETI